LQKYIYIGIGGFFGAVLRYLIKSIQIENYQGQFPVNTLAVNIAGCFLLAVLLTVTLEMLKINTDVRLGISTGFIGAFTTFSAVCKEISFLVSQGYYFTALAYLIVSVVAGLAFTCLGYYLAKRLVTYHKKKTDKLQGVTVQDGGEEP
jgi:CrcB protein